MILVICRPFAGPLYCTIKNARFVATLLCILSVLYAVPLTFEFDVYENQSVSRILQVNYQRKIYHQTLSEIGKSPTFRWIYASINALLVYLIPLTTIAILNRQLFLSIRQLEQRSQEYNAPLPTKQGEKRNASMKEVHRCWLEHFQMGFECLSSEQGQGPYNYPSSSERQMRCSRDEHQTSSINNDDSTFSTTQNKYDLSSSQSSV